MIGFEERESRNRYTNKDERRNVCYLLIRKKCALSINIFNGLNQSDTHKKQQRMQQVNEECFVFYDIQYELNCITKYLMQSQCQEVLIRKYIFFTLLQVFRWEPYQADMKCS